MLIPKWGSAHRATRRARRSRLARAEAAGASATLTTNQPSGMSSPSLPAARLRSTRERPLRRRPGELRAHRLARPAGSGSTRSDRRGGARPAARAGPRAPLPRGLAGGRGHVPVVPRHDQLRLGVVPHPAQAPRRIRLLHRGVGAGRPVCSPRGVDTRRAGRPGRARRGGVLASRPITSSWRSTPGRSTTSPSSWGTAARSTWSTPRDRSAERSRRGAHRHALLPRRGLSYKRACDHPERDLALAGVAEWDDLFGSPRSSPTTSSPTCCGSTGCCATARAGPHDRLRGAAPAGRAGARNPGLRRARVRAHRRRAGGGRPDARPLAVAAAALPNTRRARATARAPSSTDATPRTISLSASTFPLSP